MKTFCIDPLPSDGRERNVETLVRVAGERPLTLAKMDDGSVYTLNVRFSINMVNQFDTNKAQRRAAAKLCGWKMKEIDEARRADKKCYEKHQARKDIGRMQRLAKRHGYTVTKAK